MLDQVVNLRRTGWVGIRQRMRELGGSSTKILRETRVASLGATAGLVQIICFSISLVLPVA